MSSSSLRVWASVLLTIAISCAPLRARAAAGQTLTIDGASTANTCPDGGVVRDGGRACEYGGRKTFDNVSLINGAVLYVTGYDNSVANKSIKGNLELKSLGSLTIDKTSRITAKGGGYKADLCNDGPGPSAYPLSGGRGGCSVLDSGGGGAHYGKGGKGTKDCFIYPGGGTNEDVSCTFPNEWEEACGTKTSSSTCSAQTASCYGSSNVGTAGDALPDVAGQPFIHNIFDVEFGAAGGDKGCRDGFDNTLTSGNGGGRVVLFAANAAKTGTINIAGRVDADGFRGCASGNDSAGGGAGGTILIVGDTVNVTDTARISARGGRGGDSQPKALLCASDTDCTGNNANATGQFCRSLTEPASGKTFKRCDPANCTPARVSPASKPGTVAPCDAGYTKINLGGSLMDVCVPNGLNPMNYNACADQTGCDELKASECSSANGCDCLNLGGTTGKRCVPKNTPICDYLDFGNTEEECRATQNNGTCDDCAGGGGGGIVNVQSRTNNIDPRAIFDVRGGNGGICPICAGEAGAGAGELQIDAAYVEEICDGKDNNFDGQIDEGLAAISCPNGSSIPACNAGVPATCPTVAGCGSAVTDTRPRFAVVFDTSGSMLLDQSGVPHFGDGSLEFPGIGGDRIALVHGEGRAFRRAGSLSRERLRARPLLPRRRLATQLSDRQLVRVCEQLLQLRRPDRQHGHREHAVLERLSLVLPGRTVRPSPAVHGQHLARVTQQQHQRRSGQIAVIASTTRAPAVRPKEARSIWSISANHSVTTSSGWTTRRPTSSPAPIAPGVTASCEPRGRRRSAARSRPRRTFSRHASLATTRCPAANTASSYSPTAPRVAKATQRLSRSS